MAKAAVQREPVEAKASTGSRFLSPLLLVLLAASGCAALIYEIVWFQLLQLSVGSSAVSLGLLLAAYMGGLCLGSAALSRMVSVRENPLRVYALLELGIAAFGILALFFMPLIGHLPGLRGVVAFICLLPPTALMGASFPAVTRAAPDRAGLLYTANIAGAVAGCLLAGFWLLRVYDMGIATYAAAAINCGAALLAWALQKPVSVAKVPATAAGRRPGAYLIYATISVSGLTALGAEVTWTRLLSLLLGPTVYTFSIILAVFLIGLCAGSGAGSYAARRVRDPRLALAVSQMLLALAIAFTAWMLASVLPWWPVDPGLATSNWLNFDLDFMRALHAILPGTLLWGASFPLALAGARAEGEDPARLSGEVYAANTAGSILGALLFSLWLIPAIGTQGSERLLIALAAMGAVVALASCVTAGRWLFAAGTVAVAAVLCAGVGAMPWQAIAYGRRVAPILRNQANAGGAAPAPAYMGEGINASVVITEIGDQHYFYVSGKSEASSALIDMRLQRMMGHLPALVHPAPKSVLVVGFGAGVTAGSFVPYPEVTAIAICELEPLIPPASDRFFGKENNHVLSDPRARVVYDDARHFILTNPDKYDVITTDPIHPWVKGTSTLYSREYYELVKAHLNSGGVVAQWLPIYESDEETVRTELATFFSVFPNATVWSNYLDGDGYDLVLLGTSDGSRIDVDRLQQRLSRKEYAAVSASLADVEFHSAADLLATYVGRAKDLSAMTADVQVNDDMNMRLQYLAGLGLNDVAAPKIYREILGYRSFPEDLLVGGGDSFDALRRAIGRPHKEF